LLDPVKEVLTKAPVTKDLDNLIWIRDWVYRQMGILYPDTKLPLLDLRLSNLAARLSLNDIAQLKQAIESNSVPGIENHLAQVATTNHTHFFRELKALDLFRDKIIPTLPQNEPWRIWSAASSSGEELYTLAIIISELIGKENLSARTKLLGTDISPKVVRQAEEGMYPKNRVNDIPENMLNKYFDQAGMDYWEVNSQLKDACTFRRLNLNGESWPFTRQFHVIFLRNVLYYFDDVNKQKLVDKIYEATVPGGWLFISLTENFNDISHRWKSVGYSIYRKI